MKKQILSEEFKRMQKIAGIIKEGEDNEVEISILLPYSMVINADDEADKQKLLSDSDYAYKTFMNELESDDLNATLEFLSPEKINLEVKSL